MNLPLLKHLVKRNWKLWSIFAALLLFYLVVLIAIYDVMKDAEEMMAAFGPIGELYGGMQGLETAMTYVSSFYFKELVFMFSLIYIVMMSHQLVFRAVDNTSISNSLANGISRKNYITTTLVFFMGSVFALFLLLFLAGGGLLFMWGSYNIALYFNVILSTALIAMSVAAISFFFSAAFAGTKWGAPLLIGIPIMFVVFSMLSGMADSLNFLQWLTPFGWIDSLAISRGTFDLWWMWDIISIGIIATAYFAAQHIFKRKQLSI